VVRDLRVYADLSDARVYHYRDSYGLEVDAIVETRAGEWGAFEVKLGTGQIDRAAANLLKLQATVDAEPPAVLGVITSTGFGFRRDDGVCVIPIGALGP
jgi:predicted AAA+ superfamily ATPase